MRDRKTFTPAATADMAEQALRAAVAEHGLTGTLADVIDAALAAAYENGADAGYHHALTVHHIPSDD